jgi:hypothetical protein
LSWGCPATFAGGVGIGAGNAPNKLVPKFGRIVLVLGGLINAVGFLAFAWLAWLYGPSVSSWQIIPVHVVSGVGFGMVVAPTLDLLLGQVPGREASAASGLLNTVQQLGIALGEGSSASCSSRCSATVPAAAPMR